MHIDDRIQLFTEHFTLSQSFKVISDGAKFSGPSLKPNSTEVQAYGQAWLMATRRLGCFAVLLRGFR